MSMIKEFKEFATKGNVVDLAVGIIIGGAFGKIITSLVGTLIHASARTADRRSRFPRPVSHIEIGRGRSPAVLLR